MKTFILDNLPNSFKVTTLTNMKDNERLDLLKEVAGTRVYDERRKESLKIMNETEQKKLRIDEVIIYIDERLKELDRERKELKEFQVNYFVVH